MQTITKNPSWLRRRSSLERILTLISSFAVIAVIAFIIEDFPSASTAKTIKSICLTEECANASSRVLANMDPTVKPCDDFYSFACGNFIKNTNIPEDKEIVSTFSEIEDELEKQLKTLVEENPREDEPKPFKLANYLYRACMNKTLIEKRGIKPIVDISESLGGWPVTKGNNWDEASWTWQETVKSFRKIGFSIDIIIDFLVNIDAKNSTKRIINLEQLEFGLYPEYLVKGLEDKIVQAYYSYMVDMAVLFGAQRERAEIELKESLQFEINLANISLPNEMRRNSSALYNPMTIEEIQKKYPYVKWLDYINALLPEGLDVDENEIIVVAVPKFFEDLGLLLKKTPKRVIANYMMWRMHKESASFLTEELKKRKLQYDSALSGQQEQEPIEKECVSLTGKALPISVDAKYVRKYFKENAKSNVLEMVGNIRKEFEKILREVPWMDNQTRSVALDKLKTMDTHIGYPDELKDNSKLEEYYKDLEIYPDRYFESILILNAFVTNNYFNKLRKPVKTDWTSHARSTAVNAFYSLHENSIHFPAGILQDPIFSAKRPNYMNYGAIGYMIGHEITHGFDDEGGQIDMNGNLVDWWQEHTKKSYLEKAKCIIDQYANFTDKTTGLNLNGINTQGENIADNGGIKESYLAYKSWAEKYGPEPRLPSLNYSPEQMFWISAAQTRCSKYRPELLKDEILTGFHSPPEFRILGSMSNMKDFSKDFKCPEGSPMNPMKKCEVW